jgi:uncharacterized alkaline shock family protein YloU
VDKNLGKITIAPNVLVTIVQKMAHAVPGVAHLCENAPSVGRLLGLSTVGRGVRVGVVDDQILVDVYLVAKRGVDLLQMGRQLQHQVAYDIENIVGMNVREINVHVEDIETELALDTSREKEQA